MTGYSKTKTEFCFLNLQQKFNLKNPKSSVELRSAFICLFFAFYSSFVSKKLHKKSLRSQKYLMETIFCENWFSRKEDFPRVATSQTRYHSIQKQTIYNIKKLFGIFFDKLCQVFLLRNTANNKVDFFFVKLRRRCQKCFRRFRIFSGFSPLMQKNR